MDAKPITLEQILAGGMYNIQFTTSPRISNKTLLKFYSDTSQILKELDSEINFEDKPYINLHGGFFWPFSFGCPFKIKTIDKGLQVRKGDSKKFNIKDVVRAHNILYRRNSRPISKEIQERIKNNRYKNIILVRPDISIHSTNPIYNSEDFISKISDLSYISISDGYASFDFNPHEIRNIASGKKQK